jgi:hypothetical protein
VSLEWIGAALRTMQAEQRSIRDENQLIRPALSEAVTVLLQRIGNFEAHIDTRMDMLDVRLDRLTKKADQEVSAT